MTPTVARTRRAPGLHPVMRGALIALAFAGSAAYALSFAGAADVQRWTAHAAAVGIAAGISWIVFGVLLITFTSARPSVISWMDACLLTIAVGMAIKMIAVAMNLVWWWSDAFAPRAAHLAVIHLAILFCADAAMCARFCVESAARGVSMRTAAALWIALNFVFGVLLFIFWRMGGLS